MEEEKKDGNGTGLNFCVLCSKYTKDELKAVQIGTIPISLEEVIVVTANVCTGCVVIINNAARIFREAVDKIKKQREEAMKKIAMPKEKRIVAPGAPIPKGLLRFLKKN